MLDDRIKNNLAQKCGLKPGSKILLAVSGGPDSICLLEVLSKLDFEIVIAHFNHKLRPEADEEEKFVKKQAKARGMRFFSSSKNVREIAEASGKGIEEMARTARYRFLFDTALDSSADSVATAHHADDQVETILMNFLRGTGLDGLTGMGFRVYSEFNDQIPLVRPMLDTWRKEIIAYCEENRLEYMTDISNRDIRYRRNCVRHELIPYLENYNPNIKQTVLRMSDILQVDENFLEKISENKFGEVVLEAEKGNALVNLKLFQELEISIQRRVLKKLFENFFQIQLEIDLNTVETARRYLAREIESTSGVLKESVVVAVGHEKAKFLTLSRLDQNEIFPAIAEGEIIPVRSGRYRLNENLVLDINIQPIKFVANEYAENPDTFTVYLDMDAVVNSIHVRAAKSGDRFSPLGMQGKTMKLSDFWINKKLPRIARENWPVVSSGGEIIWIPGFMPSHKSRITVETKTVVILRLIRNE